MASGGWPLLLLALGLAGCRATSSATPPVVDALPDAEPEPRLERTSSEASWRLYVATVTAAELSLRLHETDRAKQWLEHAPTEHRGWEWRVLSGRSDQSTAVFPAVESAITDITVSPDGLLLAVGTAGGVTLLLDAATGDVVRVLEGHTAAVWNPTFSSDGTLLATASSDGSARIWETATGRQLGEFPDNGQGVAGLAWSPDDRRLAVGSWDRTPERGVWGTLNVWDARTGLRLRHIEHGVYPIASVAYSADGSRLVGGTWDWNLVIWDTSDWAEPVVLPPPENPYYKRITDFMFSPDGSRLAVAYADGRARIWDLGRAEVVQTLYTPAAEGQLHSLNDVAYLSGGGRLATAGADLAVRFWNLETGEQIGVFHGHDRPINTVAASPDGRRLFSGGGEGEVRVWDLEALASGRSRWDVPHVVYSVAFDPEERRAVLATWEGWLRIIEVRTGREVRAWQAHERAAVAADWSPDGRWIVSTGSDGRVMLWDAATGEPAAELQDVDRQLESVAFSPDGTLVAAPGEDAEVSLWHVPSGESAGSLVDGDAPAGAVRWASDGSLATAHGDGTVRLWDARAGTLREVFETDATGVPAIAFDPSGRKLAVATDRTVRIRDLAAGRWTAELSARAGSVVTSGLAWSPDGDRLVAALSGNVFELWDADTGDVLLRFPQTSSAWSVVWTRKNELVLVPLDQTVRVIRPDDRGAPESAEQEAAEARSRGAIGDGPGVETECTERG